ncbi:helix-turn-helix domain-containing protein [Pseudomonas turukhanskensis]|uniref:Transcriptional regulator n=1 Tax=Pseudomonas turukhanskensis TaxID=1806536 RepID=A0A9W6K3E0_9PSED|nr:helix-turn-helix transcriptional regulator [Pseudomonas turukhanskensis]GLK88800.1 transcriptional regulator [Pseudomonas turukhanskensis]
MSNQHFLFTAGQRLRGLRELMGLKRPAFSQLTGIDRKRLENIECGQQRMHDIDFEKVCGLYPEFARWITYGGPVDGDLLDLRVADSAQMSAVYLVQCNPVLLDSIGLSLEEWTQRHQTQLQLISESEALYERQLALETDDDVIEGQVVSEDDEDLV